MSRTVQIAAAKRASVRVDWRGAKVRCATSPCWGIAGTPPHDHQHTVRVNSKEEAIEALEAHRAQRPTHRRAEVTLRLG